jgi:SOS response regulatory protein OraA/RecX
MQRLEGLGLLNDERYAALWLRGRIARGEAPRKMLEGLRQKGIDGSIAARVLAESLEGEGEALLLEKRLAVLARKKLRDDMPLRRRLRSEGFSVELINLFEEEERLRLPEHR